MQTFKSLVFVASFLAAGAAMADYSVINMDTVNQTQSGDRNKQLLEVGTVDTNGITGGGWARVTANNIYQTQSGHDNTQEMILGKIDKDFGTHSTTVTANRLSQYQTGGNNSQRMKVGVVE